MPTPPIPVPTGQTLLWSTAATVVPYIGNAGLGSAVGNFTSGFLTQFGSGPLANSNYHVTWSNFQIPFILNLANVVINGIYPVVEYNGTVISTDTGCTLGNIGLAGYPWSTVPGNSFSGENHVSSGTSLSVIPTLSTTVALDQTLPIGLYGHTDFIDVTYVGIAIYATIPPLPSVSVSIGNTRLNTIGVK